MTTKVAVIGAKGRMGATACEAVDGAADLELVGRFDEGDDLGDLGGADVVVEFTVLAASERNVRHCVERGVHVVVGTSGWTDDRAAQLRTEVEAKGGVGVLIAPNFAIGAVLMMQFAKQAARFYESVEVVELHHPRKVDAPSGTATRTAELIAASRAEAGLGRSPTRRPRTPTVPVARASRASRSTRCACAVWWPTRRCCSATRARCSRSVTTPSTGSPSCPGSSPVCVRSASTRV